MKTIFKYFIRENNGIVNMPRGSKILTVQMQKDKICIWAEVEDDNELTQRKFLVFGTGFGIDFKDKEISYIGTVQDREFVWHVYERVS